MEAMVIVLTFAVVASALAVLREVAEQRTSRRAIRLVARRRPSEDRALAGLRRAADALRNLD
jgi:hypothetical protein